jgi:molecular chaperone DnaK (HSP70)
MMPPPVAVTPPSELQGIGGITVETKRVFGVDLGTTYSCIAWLDDAGQLAIIPNFEGDPTTPSVVLFEGAEHAVVGKEAKNSAMLSADQVVELVKREMGNAEWRFSVGTEGLSPEEVSSYILRKIAKDAKQHTGVDVEDVVITCPAYFGVAEREATKNAGVIAGLNVLEVINEPTAAAIAFGLQAEKDQTVLVYDLGGGTFDVTMLEICGGQVTVVATGGDHVLGGRNWDERIVTYLAAEWMTATGSDDDPLEDRATAQELWLRAEDAKKTLTARSETKVPVSHAGQRASVTVSREKFDALTADLLDRTVQYTRDLLALAKTLGQDGFDQMLLVGGSTKMPQIAARLTAEFGVEPVSFEPDQAVAKGAAFYGQKLAVDDRIRIVIAERLSVDVKTVNTAEAPEEVQTAAVEEVAADLGLRLPTVQKMKQMTVTNVTSHSFGVVAVDGRTGAEVVANLILAQDKLPASVTQRFATQEANQPDVHIQIMENVLRDRKIDVEKGLSIGTAVLPLSPGLPEDAPVEITFALAQDGRLSIVGRDLASGGAQIEATVETGRVLTQEDVEAAKARSRAVTIA